MKLYTGIDLHSNNSYVVVIDEEERIVMEKRVPNDVERIKKELSGYRDRIQGIVIESTYNWYWLADGLQGQGYSIHLANTAAIQQYRGLKYTDDRSDATWLAQLLRLNLLSEGYIYPKEKRGLRELLRRRLLLVRQQTRYLLSIQGILTRYKNIRLGGEKIKSLTEEKLKEYVQDEPVRIALKSLLALLKCTQEQVMHLEKSILVHIKEDRAFHLLQGVPGIGRVLAMTILLETGSIQRFKKVGHYSSYARCVESRRLSNGKKKGSGNRKNGNAYLSGAFVEASIGLIRYNELAKKYYQRKVAKTNRVVAIKTISNKLSKACYFILRDGVEFDVKKLFS
jgi:transposase